MHHCENAGSELFEATGDATEVEELAEVVFDLVSRLVQIRIVGGRLLAVLGRRNNQFDVLLEQRQAGGVTVVGTVSGIAPTRPAVAACSINSETGMVSCRGPSVRVKATAECSSVQATCNLVVNPPRERPKASVPPFFGRASGVWMHRNQGAVDEQREQSRACSLFEQFPQVAPDSGLLPAPKAHVYRAPRPEPLRQISPRTPGARQMQHRLRELTLGQIRLRSPFDPSPNGVRPRTPSTSHR